MNIFLIFLCSFSIGSCDRKTTKALEAESHIGVLRETYEKKRTHAQKTFDKETGWPETESCDATLWASLARAAVTPGILLDRAKQADGSLYRNLKGTCERSNEYTRHLYAYTLARSRENHLPDLTEIYGYGTKNNWGVTNPLLLNVLCRSLKKLGSRQVGECGGVVGGFGAGADYQERFDAAIRILLWNEVTEEIPAEALENMTRYAYLHAKDALFSAVYAKLTSKDYSHAMELLLGDYEYPSYVGGEENFKITYWLFTANLILQNISK